VAIVRLSRVPDALQRPYAAAQSRDPASHGYVPMRGPGSAAHRRRGAALRPGHESGGEWL